MYITRFLRSCKKSCLLLLLLPGVDSFRTIIIDTYSSARGVALQRQRTLSNCGKVHAKTKLDDEEVIETQNVEDTDVPSWVRAIIEWPSLASSSTSRSTSEWLRGPVQDHEEAWLEEIVGSEGKKNYKETSNGKDSSPINPLINLINLENKLTEMEGKNSETLLSKNVSSSELKEIYSPFDLPIRPNMDLSALEELGGWVQWVDGIQQNMASLTTDQSFAKSAETALKQATTRIEETLLEASSALSPAAIQTLISQAQEDLLIRPNTTTSADAPQQLIQSSSLDVTDIVEDRDTKSFAVNLVAVADRVLRRGYVEEGTGRSATLDESGPLFSEFSGAKEINVYNPYLQSVAEMGALSGAIYLNSVERCHEIEHSICAQGYSSNVFWMVTDCVMPSTAFSDRIAGPAKDFSVRVISVRGFDASDEEVDRELLLNGICAADSVPSVLNPDVLLHSGLLDIAKSIYKDVKNYIEWSSPSTKIVLCGHSIGGSLATLILLLMVEDYGRSFVQEKVLRVFAFGNPPIACLRQETAREPTGIMVCDTLSTLKLPTNLVHCFCQPWDPIVRLFTEIDPLYPLAEDLGVDGMTPWNDGPPRALRPILKRILEAWDGWPRFRETFQGQSNQNYTSIGVQHILLPEPTRFLADRFVAVNIQVPQVETIVRLSSSELLPALAKVFPLDTFEVSFVPQAIRSFVHHFFPAYDAPIVSFAKRRRKKESASGGKVETGVSSEGVR